MGLGYTPRKNKDYNAPQLVPGRKYAGDRWSWLRTVLIALFLVFDLVGLLVLLFPGAITLARNAASSRQSFLFPTTSLPRLPALAPSTAPGPAATPPVARTAAPASTATSTSASGVADTKDAPPGIYVQSIRTDPATPRRNQDVTFYVTFQNTTKSTETVRWDVLVYRPEDLRKYFGQSLPVGKGDMIPSGSHELRSFGSYRLTGGGGCEQVVIRVARLDEGQPAILLTQPGGSAFLQTITICP